MKIISKYLDMSRVHLAFSHSERDSLQIAATPADINKPVREFSDVHSGTGGAVFQLFHPLLDDLVVDSGTVFIDKGSSLVALIE